MEEQKKRLKLFVIDDSDIFRAGLAAVLGREEDDFDLSGCGKPSDETEALCAAASPDVLVIHSSAREMDTHFEIAGRLKGRAEGLRVLIIVEFTDIDYLMKIAASGCDGYVHSGISERALVRIIRNLGNDVYIFDRAVIDKMIFLNDKRRSGRTEFSPRERRIVEMLAEGENNAAIAKELNLSAGTVKNIISDMLKRYRYRKRSQLVSALLP
jgi:DNA-binding NarL/FixJ family response regulator